MRRSNSNRGSRLPAPAPIARAWSRRRVLGVIATTGVLAACGVAAPPPPRGAPDVPPAVPTATVAAATPSSAPTGTTPTASAPAGTSAAASPAARPTAPPTPAPTVDDGLRRLDGYGFQAHLWNQDRRFIIDRTQTAGFNWLKQQVEWQQIEPFEKRGFDWRELDKIVAAVNGSGLNLLLSIVKAPEWALGDREHGPPGDPLDFEDFMRELAGRYRGRVQAYELWNEANLSREWGYGRIDAGEFVELLVAGRRGAKAGDPAVLTIGGALTPAGDVNIPDQRVQAVDDLRFLRQMYQYRNGLVRQGFDAWGMHPGGFNNAPGQPIGSSRGDGWNGHPSFYFQRFTQHRDVMEEFGDADKPIWLTEFGWSTANAHPAYGYGKDNSEPDQARFLADAFRIVRARFAYVSHMFVWNLNFQLVIGPEDEKYPFGVLNSDGTARPAYDALVAMPKGV